MDVFSSASSFTHPHFPTPEFHPSLDAVSSPEAQAEIEQLLDLLCGPGGKGGGDAGGGGGGGAAAASLERRLETAEALLRDSVLPCLTDSAARMALGPGGIERLPLGFETGGALLCVRGCVF